MTFSPLQLIKYHIEEFAYKANSEYQKGGQIKPENFQVSFESGENERNSLQRRIRLIISQDISKDGNEPYSFKIVMVAFFEVVKEFFDQQGPEKIERLVNANGPALLYSAARELLALIAGRGPCPEKETEFFLPSITFINFKNTKEPQEKAASKRPKKISPKTDKEEFG